MKDLPEEEPLPIHPQRHPPIRWRRTHLSWSWFLSDLGNIVDKSCLRNSL